MPCVCAANRGVSATVDAAATITQPITAADASQRGPRTTRKPPWRRERMSNAAQPRTVNASSPVVTRSGVPTASLIHALGPKGAPIVRDIVHSAITKMLSSPRRNTRREGCATSATANASWSHALAAKKKPCVQVSAKCTGANAACTNPAPNDATPRSTSSGRNTSASARGRSLTGSVGNSSPSSESRTSSDIPAPLG